MKKKPLSSYPTPAADLITEKGWWRGEPCAGEKECPITAVDRVYDSETADAVLVELLADIGGGSIPTWNDDVVACKRDMLTKLRRAERAVARRRENAASD